MTSCAVRPRPRCGTARKPDRYAGRPPRHRGTDAEAAPVGLEQLPGAWLGYSRMRPPTAARSALPARCAPTPRITKPQPNQRKPSLTRTIRPVLPGHCPFRAYLGRNPYSGLSPGPRSVPHPRRGQPFELRIGSALNRCHPRVLPGQADPGCAHRNGGRSARTTQFTEPTPNQRRPSPHSDRGAHQPIASFGLTWSAPGPAAHLAAAHGRLR
jgi:hypothetical protein